MSGLENLSRMLIRGEASVVSPSVHQTFH